ncbi:MAG: 4-hydroxythreonine-4-phosphate dehydrogenase PdxA [Candidatus Latescibacteria bacterium]|nr:4-hydroxythreonine-4-phosphate dehydrogenase PdxA [Candidatus Latescibacterota bacterium]NIM22635.1 4-hydroxythreonine-4-phosphate dehydrogenase PdxA [Candidatus Latescibacterota bacterium]NIM64924.1 4-hydroxythreonine-4-phosphate dehydrogenase PdxA [Candidatus Latescibacterota bacterium]NIO01439.1 4-hydroxythreonine-4-phosphate dehydrogenase PdxA [Candidatus Latescibacterota bacterium]NIO27949.1 4-hydroxythreonine-4-phosphate dehydrogenase PdxA [Candidatus Latescibacterota bacterium]
MTKRSKPAKTGAPRDQATSPIIAVTTGDPAGIGPEIVVAFFAAFQPSHSKAVVIGSPEVIRPWADRYGWNCPILSTPEEMDEVEQTVSFGAYVLDTGCGDPVPAGRSSREGGKHAGRAIELACRLADGGLVEAIVTAPISKESLNMAGYAYSGHTEMLAAHFDSPDSQMMMVYRELRVVPLTRHLAIAAVREHVTERRILACLAVVDRALRDDFDIDAPRIAVAALNPHAGEGGAMGREEVDVIAPALRRAREEGIRAEGPFAADSLFQSSLEGRYDAFVTMYHDQGLIPFKMAAQKRGVNVTIGLPVIRTSVDHGVAFDIAGKGEADVASIKAAYELAEKLVEARRRSGGG